MTPILPLVIFFGQTAAADPTGGWAAVIQTLGVAGGGMVMMMVFFGWIAKKVLDRHIRFLDDFTLEFKKQTRAWRRMAKQLHSVELRAKNVIMSDSAKFMQPKKEESKEKT